MRKNTLLKVLLAGFASLTLICAPQSLFAQHGSGGGGSHGGSGGGSHGGGGGGFHGGGGGGSVHSGGYGGFHGGAGSYGGYRGGERQGYGGGSRYGRMGGESPSTRNSGATRSSSSLGRADTSPRWHSFERSGGSGGAATGHQMGVADGQWHSFGSARGSAGTAIAANSRFGGNGEFTHGGAWGGRGWGGGGWGGRGWRGGWGYPGYGFGWGCWACGWGFGYGWGIGWNPYWALYPYPYWDNLWWGDPYGYDAPPYYIYPYPA
jgi:hypothetical protein